MGRPFLLDKEQIVICKNKYISGLNSKQIAKEFNVSSGTICNMLRMLGLKIRTNASRFKKGNAFGNRFKKGNTTNIGSITSQETKEKLSKIMTGRTHKSYTCNKICEICNKYYLAKAVNQRWCDNCKNITLVCDNCSNNFDVSRTKHLFQTKKGQKYWFCSIKCKSNFPEFQRIHKENARKNLLPLLKGNKYREGIHITWKKERLTKRINCICECCGKKLKRLKSSMRGKRIFCSPECKDNSEIGRKKNEEFREKCKQSALKQFKNGMPEKTKRKLREAQIRNVEKQVFDGLPIMPCIGKHETKILDLIEKVHNIKILRQHKTCGYFLDGYCKELNLAIEVDEPFHNKPEQLKKDNYREKQIKNELNCQFLRIEV